MFRTLDFLAVEYDQLGMVRERTGNQSVYSAPSNIYRTRDGRWLSLAISVQSVFERFVGAMDAPELATDLRFSTNTARVANRDALDRRVAGWIAAQDLAEVGATLLRHEVSFSPVYSIRDVFEDPHFREREMVVAVHDRQLGELKMQNVVPRFSRTPGGIRGTGPDLGEHNEEVFGALGLGAADLEALRARGVV